MNQNAAYYSMMAAGTKDADTRKAYQDAADINALLSSIYTDQTQNAEAAMEIIKSHER